MREPNHLQAIHALLYRSLADTLEYISLTVAAFKLYTVFAYLQNVCLGMTCYICISFLVDFDIYGEP